MRNRRPKVRKLAQRHDSHRLVAALSYRDHVADSLDRVYDLGAGVRRDAALALASMPHADGLDVGAALVGALADSSGEVRRAAASSLGVRGEHRAVQALSRGALTWDGLRYEAARAAAADALVALAAAKTAQTFVSVAVQTNYEPARARDLLARLIAGGGGQSARAASAAATAALCSGERDVCERAVEVLAWLGADSVGPLLSIAGRPGEARVPAIRALSRLRDLRSAESLSRLLADDDPNVRCAAAGALGELSDPRVAPRLLEAATDSDHRVREAALEAVHKLRPIAVAADDDGAAQHAVRLASRTGLRG